MSSKPLRGLIRRLILLLLIPFAALSASCAAAPKNLMITIPPILHESCPRADVGPLATVGDMGALILREEAALTVCDGRRQALTAIVDAHAQIVKPRPWWRVWR